MTTRQISNANLLIPLNLPAVATFRLGETVHVRIGHTVSFFVPQPPKIASGIHLLIQAFINFLFTHAEKKTGALEQCIREPDNKASLLNKLTPTAARKAENGNSSDNFNTI